MKRVLYGIKTGVLISPRRYGWFRALCLSVLLTFSGHLICADMAQALSEPHNAIMLPPGTLMASSAIYSLPTLKAISIDPKDPFKINFIVDTQDQSKLDNIDQGQVNLLVKYFLSFLTLPEKDLWVNLSPYEKDHIIAPQFEKTNAGRDMLIQDYMLKQLAASLTYPDHKLGKAFWSKVFKRVKAEYGSNNIPVTSFNKVWVVPDKATVYEENGSAFIAESRLKVLTEEDYLSIEKNKTQSTQQQIDHVSTEITREIIIPELEREVNEGEYFSSLRQMYNALILAIWFKKRYKTHLVNQVYVNKKKISGINLNETQIKEKIYRQYLMALKKGAYNFVREDYDESLQQQVPRKYFSGGFSFVDAAMQVNFLPASNLGGISRQIDNLKRKMYGITVLLNPRGMTKSNLMGLMAGALMTIGGGSNVLANSSTTPQPVVATLPMTPLSKMKIQRVQATLNNIDNNLNNILGNHPDAVGYERLRSLLDALEALPQESYLQAPVQQLRKAILDPQFFQSNIDARNQFSSKGAHVFTKSPSRLAVDKAIKELRIVLGNPMPQKPETIIPFVQPATNATPVQEPLKPTISNTIPTQLVKATLKPTPPNVPLPNLIPINIPTPSPIKLETLPIPPIASTPIPSANVMPPAVSATNVLEDSKIQPYSLSTSVMPIAVEDQVVARNTGIITGLDPTKKEYKVGENICFILDPELNGRIEALRIELGIRQRQLDDLKKLFNSQAASAQEIVKAQHHVDDITQKLAKANQEQSANVVIAPHDLRIKDLRIVNGMKVVKGDAVFGYYDMQRIRLNFKVPTTVNYFNRMEGLTLNGQAVLNIINLDWSFDPLQQGAQVSAVAISSTAIPLNQDAQLKGEILAPQIPYTNLQTIVGNSQTLASVREVQHHALKAPSDGPVKFLVREGQVVKQGQVVAVIDHTHYDQEYEGIRLAIKNIDIQIAQAKDTTGVQLITREELDRLSIERAAFVSRLANLKEVIQRLSIRAPSNGIVSHLSAHGSRVFQSQDELLRISTGTAFIGDIKGIKNPILFPNTLNIKVGDPILIQTPQGIRLPAKVVAVNQAPYSDSLNLSGFQAIEVIAYDQQGILQPNLPTQIILPSNDTERTLINDALALVYKEQSYVAIPSLPPPPAKNATLQHTSLVAPTSLVSTPLATQTNTYQLSLALSDVDRLVHSNQLVTGFEAIEVLKKKQEENLPRATRFSLNGGVWMKEGKLVFGGGFKGMVNNMVGGGIQSGNAIGSAIPVVYQIAGNIIDLVSGKVNKQTALAVQMTQIAYHHMETEVYRQVNETQGILIDLGAAQQKIDQIKELLRDLEKSRDVIKARQETGFSLKTDEDQLERHIQETKSKLADLEGKKDKLTIALNFAVGNSTTNLHQTIGAQLPWNKPFTAIDETTEAQLRTTLTSTNSPNSRMKESIAASKAIDMTVKLQGLNQLPDLNLASLYVSDGGGYNPLYNFSPNESLLRTSTLTGGGNSLANIEIPLFDSTIKTKAALMALEQKKGQLNQEKTEGELSQELGEAIGSLRNLSAQIQQTQVAYEQATQVWQAKAKRLDIFLPYQSIDERIEMIKLGQSLIDLKARYFKEEARLRKMGLLGPEQAAPSNTLSSLTVTSTQALPDTFINQPIASLNTEEYKENAPNRFMSTGEVSYQLTQDTASTWALMQNTPEGSTIDSLTSLKRILIEDPNIFVRADALNHFFNEYQNDTNFMTAVHDIVLHTAYSDVMWKILRFMGEREDQGLNFIIQTIHHAATSHHQVLMDLGFQSLADTLTLNPQSLRGLLPDNPEIANKVFLTFLAKEPDNSAAKAKFIQSDFWDTDDLTQIHHALSSYINTHPGDSHLNGLLTLIYDSIVRKEAISSIDEIFRPGWFKELGKIVSDRDIITYVEIGENATQNRDFLTKSAQWQQMGNYIYPKLYKEAKQAADKLTLNQRSSESTSPLYELSGQRTLAQELDYFNSLGSDAQHQYISSSRNLPELARILTLQTPQRAAIIDRLMASPQGRMLVLTTYLNSTDARLLQLIESRSWKDTLRGDIRSINDSANTLTCRLALEKLYARTQAEWALNMRLATFSAPELHVVKDPRGDNYRDAQINVAATRVALNVVQERLHYKAIFYAGQALQTPREKQELSNIITLLDYEIDPLKINAHITNQLARTNDGKTKEMLEDLITTRDIIAKNIKSNDQTVPKFPLVLLGTLPALALIPLGFFFKGLHYRVWLRRASEEALIKELYNKLLDGEDRPRTLIIPPPNRVYNSTEDLLKNWYQLVSNWEKQENLPIETILNDFNTILNYAEEVLNDMPYSPDLMWSEGKEAPKNDLYQKTFSYFNVLALTTLSVLKKRIQSDKLTRFQRLKLEDDIDVLFDNINYSSRFSRILAYRGNIEKVMSYKFPNNHWTERTMLYPLSRAILLYKYLWNKSQQQLMNELPKLLEEGNALIDGLYEKPSQLVNDSVQLLKNVTDNGRTSYDPVSRDDRIKYRMRSFYSRSLSLLGLGATVVTAVCLLLGVPGITVGGLSLLGLVTLGMSYGAYWHPHLDVMKMKWNSEMASVINKLRKDLTDMLNPSGNQVITKDKDADIISLAQQEGIEQTRRELDLSHPPSVDMIVIIPQEKENHQALENYVESRRGSLIRQDIPALVMASDYQGSANAYMDIMQQLKTNYATYKERYPNLRPWNELRIMVVLHGTHASKESSVQNSLLDLGISNGYRAARNGSIPDNVTHKAGHIMINTRDAYFGPIPEFPNSGITMLTSRVNSRVLSEASLINARVNSTGQREVIELLEGVDLNSLQANQKTRPRVGKLLTFIKDHFNLHNPSLNQYPVLNGIYLIGPDAVNVFSQMADYLNKHHLWEKLTLRLTSDLFVPMIMGNVYDEHIATEVNEYALKRIRWKDMGGRTSVRRELAEFYAHLNQIAQKAIKINSSLPYSKSEVFFHIAGAVADNELARYKKVGGISFVGTSDILHINDAEEISSSGKSNFSLNAFQGFDFQIIDYKPILNPVELFLGSSVQPKGLWFTSQTTTSAQASYTKA